MKPENLFPWSERVHGARLMLYYLWGHYKVDFMPEVRGQDKQVYNKAIYEWLMSDLRNIEAFMAREPFYFTDHERDAKGRLKSVKITTKDPKR